MIKQLILVIFFLLSSKLYAQTIQGKVIDETSGTGIPFASIGIVGTNNATVTNENGDFILKINTFPVKVKVSHVSYLSIEVDLNGNQEKLAIALKPASITLTEVTIDPFKGQRMIKEALEMAKIGSVIDFYGKAFYRQLTAINNQPSQIYELFYDLKWNTKRVQGWSANQSRFAETRGDMAFSLDNQSFLTFAYSGYLRPEKEGKFVNLQTLADYQITIEKYIDQADQKIAVISCRYKSPKKKTYYVNSTYYIGVDDHKVYRMENSIFNLPMKFTNASPKFPPVVTTVATFSGANHPVSVLESISTNFFVTLTFNGRQFDGSTSSLLTLYELDESLKNIDFETTNSKVSDKKIVESLKYDPLFWKNNPIVKQTSLEDSFIKMMESKSAFGTMINR